MLILAGVMLSIVINGGLFEQAELAIQETRGGTVQERIRLWEAEREIYDRIGVGNPSYSNRESDRIAFVNRLYNEGLLNSSNERDALLRPSPNSRVEIGTRDRYFQDSRPGGGSSGGGDYTSLFPPHYEWIPIYTREHLEAIGSGVQITINGTTYTFLPNANYTLRNNINLSAQNWIPLGEGTFGNFEGIFLGNNRTISNLNVNGPGTRRVIS